MVSKLRLIGDLELQSIVICLLLLPSFPSTCRYRAMCEGVLENNIHHGFKQFNILEKLVTQQYAFFSHFSLSSSLLFFVMFLVFLMAFTWFLSVFIFFQSALSLPPPLCLSLSFVSLLCFHLVLLVNFHFQSPLCNYDICIWYIPSAEVQESLFHIFSFLLFV